MFENVDDIYYTGKQFKISVNKYYKIWTYKFGHSTTNCQKIRFCSHPKFQWTSKESQDHWWFEHEPWNMFHQVWKWHMPNRNIYIYFIWNQLTNNRSQPFPTIERKRQRANMLCLMGHPSIILSIFNIFLIVLNFNN